MRLIAVLGCLSIVCAHGAEKLFSVRDSIGLQQFVDPDAGSATRISKFSPDGKHFIVVTQRGLLAQDRVQSTIWMFDADAERGFLEGHTEHSVAPATGHTRCHGGRHAVH